MNSPTHTYTELFKVNLAVGETIILLHPPFSRCFNRDDEGVPAK